MNKIVTVIERIAGYFIGLVAVLTFSEAVMRYVFVMHIPDVFVIGQMLQGIAICWGIATAAYADRHITVDIPSGPTACGGRLTCSVIRSI